MSDIIRLPKEVVEAIQRVLSNEFHDKPEDIIRIHARDPLAWSVDVIALNGFPLDTLIRALYIGYEIEQTPEDKVRELYEKSESPHYRAGIGHTLDALNIHYKGVNC